MYTPIVRHWRRGEIDRLYIGTVSGRQLGWFDLVDETLHTPTDGLRSQLWRAVSDFRLGRRPDLPAAEDLATHQAGCWELDRASRCVDESPLFYSASTVCNERDERSEWQAAAAAATAVAGTVASLSGGWLALHGVPSGRFAERLDHVLVGPAGVVVVLSEHVAGGEVLVGGGEVAIDGVGHKMIAHLRKLADHVATRCPAGVPVHVVVTVHGASAVTGKPVGDDRVHVVAADQLVSVLATRPEVLDDRARDILYALLRHRSTWCTRAASATRVSEPAASVGGIGLLDGLPRLPVHTETGGLPDHRPKHAAGPATRAAGGVAANAVPVPEAVPSLVPAPVRARRRRFGGAVTRPTAA